MNDNPHKVQLYHYKLSGKKKLIIDDEVIENKEKNYLIITFKSNLMILIWLIKEIQNMIL